MADPPTLDDLVDAFARGTAEPTTRRLPTAFHLGMAKVIDLFRQACVDDAWGWLGGLIGVDELDRIVPPHSQQ